MSRTAPSGTPRRRLVHPALALFVAAAAAGSAATAVLAADRPKLAGTWEAESAKASGGCRVALTATAVEGTPYRNARRIGFPNGRAACAGLPIDQADIWVVERGKLRLGRVVGPGQYEFVPFERVSAGRYRHPVVTLTRAGE